MADSANVRTLWAEDIIYNTWRASLFLQTFYQGWQTLFDRAKTVRLPILESNIQVDFPADTDALAAAPSFQMAEITGTDWSREFIRATKRINKREMQEAGGGGMLDSQTNEELAIEMGLGVDDKFLTAIRSLAYTAVTNANLHAAGNAITTGDATNHVDRAFPYTPANQATIDAVIEGFKSVHMLFGQKRVIPGQGQFTGSNQPGMLVGHYALPIAKILVEELSDEGSLERPTDIDAQAVIDRTLPGGDVAYMGRAYGVDIVANPAIIPPPASAGAGGLSEHWDNFIYPANSTLAGGFSVLGISDSDFDDGNTGGRFVSERTSVGIYSFKAVRPQHVVRHRVTAG